MILPPGYEGPVPDGYFTAQSTSYINFVALRGFQVDGSPAAASQMFRNGVKIYPLDRRDDPPAMEFINKSNETFNTIHANNIEFYDEIHTVIDREPVEILDPETRGLLATIGIRKGQPFQPDEGLRKILVDAVAVGNATARALFFSLPEGEDNLYEGSKWKRGFFGGNYEFLLDGGGNERNLDARTCVFYMATLNTPAMAAKMIGKGSQYAWGDHDSDGNYLDGAQNYRLQLPATRLPTTSGRSWSTTPRRDRSSRQHSPSREETASTATGSPTPTARLTSTWDSSRRRATRATGSRPFPARAGSASFGSTARSNPGSTSLGGRARSSSSPSPRQSPRAEVHRADRPTRCAGCGPGSSRGVRRVRPLA
jgi:hypothetical protein